jgi:hypothetical protein
MFNPIESTCFKVISQAFLDNAKVWSDKGKMWIGFKSAKILPNQNFR